jgi:hypothetical protein
MELCSVAVAAELAKGLSAYRTAKSAFQKAKRAETWLFRLISHVVRGVSPLSLVALWKLIFVFGCRYWMAGLHGLPP